MSTPAQTPFSSITNNPNDTDLPAPSVPASGPLKPNNIKGATQAGRTDGPTTGPAAGIAPVMSSSNAYEAASIAWQKKTQAEKEAVYLETFGSRQPPWADDTDEPVDDGADLDYENGPG